MAAQVGSDVPFFGIQKLRPPRRVEYRNQKSLQKQSDVISSSLTTLGPAAEGSIHFEDTLGRCHIAEDSDCGFRWFSEGSTVEEFVASEFVGYNQGLGRAYFKSFYHRSRKIEVGNFVKKRFGGFEFSRRTLFSPRLGQIISQPNWDKLSWSKPTTLNDE